MTYDLVAHLQRQMAFSQKTFGPGDRLDGISDHIRKELAELKACASGETLPEWIDLVMLALDGAWRSGASPEQVADSLAAKLVISEQRQWPDWRKADPTKAVEHIR